MLSNTCSGIHTSTMAKNPNLTCAKIARGFLESVSFNYVEAYTARSLESVSLKHTLKLRKGLTANIVKARILSKSKAKRISYNRHTNSHLKSLNNRQALAIIKGGKKLPKCKRQPTHGTANPLLTPVQGSARGLDSLSQTSLDCHC